MARQVYFDPFGSYASGYDSGMNRQMALEQNVRAARDIDYDFYNMKPIELEAAQRRNAFEAYADPAQRDLVRFGRDRAENALFTENLGLDRLPAQMYGIPDFYSDRVMQRYNLTPSMNLDTGNTEVMWRNPADPAGTPAQQLSSMPNYRGNILDFINRPEIREEEDRLYKYNQDAYTRDNDDFYRRMQQFYMNERLGGAGSSGGVDPLEGM